MVRNSLKRRVGAVLVACALGLASTAGAQPLPTGQGDSLVGWLFQAVEKGLTALWAGSVAKNGNSEPRAQTEQGPGLDPDGGATETSPGLDPSGKS
jgi:hypothetical protein